MSTEQGIEYLRSIGKYKEPDVQPKTTFGQDIISTGRQFLGQGVLLGWGDELEAKVKSYLQNRPYNEILNEIRGEIANFEDQNPGIAITSEILGSIAPTALAMMLPGGQAFGTTSAITKTSKLMSALPKMVERSVKTAPLAMTESGIYAVGKGEEGIEKDIKEFAPGAVWGLIGTVGTQAIFSGGQKAINFIGDKVRQKLGDKVAVITQKQIDKLVSDSGMTIAEIVEGIHAGRILADNQTLNTAIRSLFTESGAMKQQLTKQQKAREMEQMTSLEEKVQESLIPGYKGNVTELFNKSTDDIRDEAGKFYKEVFTKYQQELPEEVINDLRSAVQSKTIREKIQEIYDTDRTLVPFFKGDEIYRAPTLQDAERIRRALRDLGMEKSGEVAGNIRRLERELKSKLNQVSPDLANVRKTWEGLERSKNAFTWGKTKGITGKIEDISLEVNRIKENLRLGDQAEKLIAKQELDALRQGTLSALKDKLKNKGYISKLGDEGSLEYEKLRLIFPNESIDNIVTQAQNTSDAIAMRRLVSGLRGGGGGSPTQANIMEESSRIMQGLKTGDIFQVASGIAKPILDKIAPNLSDTGRMQILETLYSKDPEFVRRMLTGRTPMGEIQERFMMELNRLGYKVIPGAVATQQDEQLPELVKQQLPPGLLNP